VVRKVRLFLSAEYDDTTVAGARVSLASHPEMLIVEMQYLVFQDMPEGIPCIDADEVYLVALVRDKIAVVVIVIDRIGCMKLIQFLHRISFVEDH
jgi:hypothetical protein